MLYYTEFGLSHREVPNEESICIYISGCQNRCANCHYPELQRPNYGDLLFRNYRKIIELYLKAASCVCFLGEGKNTLLERKELTWYSAYAHTKGLKTCLYSGRDTFIEKWMKTFDYIKIGSYQPEQGALSDPRTNQRMYRKSGRGYVDITKEFWNGFDSEDIEHKSGQ